MFYCKNMITVAVRKNSIAVSGHAQRPADVPPGCNIICAAVSAITQNLLDGLMNIAMEEVESVSDNGLLTIRWQHLSETGKALVDTWFLGICGIEQSYGEITII